MLVRIVSCNIPEAWYHDNIGREFEVLPYDQSCWVIPYPFKYWNLPPLLLLRSDCEEVKTFKTKSLSKEIKTLEKLQGRIQEMILENGGKEDE